MHLLNADSKLDMITGVYLPQSLQGNQSLNAKLTLKFQKPPESIIPIVFCFILTKWSCFVSACTTSWYRGLLWLCFSGVVVVGSSQTVKAKVNISVSDYENTPAKDNLILRLYKYGWYWIKLKSYVRAKNAQNYCTAAFITKWIPNEFLPFFHKKWYQLQVCAYSR